MKICAENVADIRKYFMGCYVKYPMTGEHLCTVDSVTVEGITGKIYMPGASGTVEAKVYQYPFDEQGFDMEFILPIKSYFNYDGHAMFLNRIPARQYRKGICTDNVNLSKLIALGVHKTTLVNGTVLTHYVGKQAFAPFGTEKCVSYAVSPRMAVVVATGFLFLDKVRIGMVRGNTIIVKSGLFVDEVAKVVRNLGQRMEIVEGKLPVMPSQGEEDGE